MALPLEPGHLDEVAASFRGLAHPTRLRILDVLRDEGAELSPTQVADRIEPGTGLANVAYHTRELAGLGLVTPAGERVARGALEHFYRLSDKGRELIELVDRLSPA
jgi:DNA-binding transcriptional ArsR family regulator